MRPSFLLRWFFAACLGCTVAGGKAEPISIDDSVADSSHVALLQQNAQLARSTLDWGKKTKKVAVIYMASGQKFVVRAFTAASSLRRSLEDADAKVGSMPEVKIVLYTDEPLPHGVPSAPFDSVDTHVIPGLIGKYSQHMAAMRASKIYSMKDALANYDYVIYLDSDTLVCSANLILGIVSALDMGVHVAGVPEKSTRDWLRLDQSGDIHVPATIPTSVTLREINGGMIGARSSGETRDLFDLWAKYHAKSFRNEECAYDNPAEAGRDQKPLMCALNASRASIAYMSGGYNCKSWNSYGVGTDWEPESPTYCGMETDSWSTTLLTTLNVSGLKSTTCFLVHGQNSMQGWNK